MSTEVSNSTPKALINKGVEWASIRTPGPKHWLCFKLMVQSDQSFKLTDNLPTYTMKKAIVPWVSKRNQWTWAVLTVTESPRTVLYRGQLSLKTNKITTKARHRHDGSHLSSQHSSSYSRIATSAKPTWATVTLLLGMPTVLRPRDPVLSEVFNFLC